MIEQRLSPYQGLTPFDEGDADYFFGREKETRLIIADLFAAPLTVLYGASGVGKSSVLRAGVLRALRGRDEFCAVLFNAWQSPPLGPLKRSVLDAVAQVLGQESMADREIKAWAETLSPATPLDEFLKEVGRKAKRRLVIILDQFEEYSLYYPQGELFADQFAAAARVKDLSLSFIVSLREEAVARLDRFEGKIPTVLDNFRRIDHLGMAQARDAVIEPLSKYRTLHSDAEGPSEIESQLVDAVLRQVRSGQVHLGDSGRGVVDTPEEGRIEAPYLQLVMTRLWNEEVRESSRLLQYRTLLRLGGAENIVRSHLDAVMGTFSPAECNAAARIFELLVTPSGTKIAHSAEDLADMAGVDSVATRDMLRRLEQGQDRILRSVAPAPDHPGVYRYEIFHDRLAPAVLSWRARYVQEHGQSEAARGSIAALQQVAETFLNALDPQVQHVAAGVLPALVGNSRVGKAEIEAAASRAAEQIGLSPEGVRNSLESLAPLIKIEGDSYSLHSALTSIVADWTKRRQEDPSRSAKRPQPGQVQGQEPRGFFGSVADFFTRTYRTAIGSQLTTLLAKMPQVPASVGGKSEQAPDGHGSIEPPPYSMIGGLLAKGLVITVIGNGVSLSERSEPWKAGTGGVPTNQELTDWVASQVAFPRDADTAQPSFGEVASFCVMVAGPDVLDDLLRQAFQLRDAPTRMHRYLANVARHVPLVILTTTWDAMIERAFDEAGVQYNLLYNVYSPSEGVGLRRLSPGASVPELLNSLKLERDENIPCVYKLFGSLSAERRGTDYLIATEEGQMALFAEIMAGRLPPPVIREKADTQHSLFLGVGLRGWTERQLFSLLRPPRYRRQTNAWAIIRGVSALEQNRWASLGVDVYDEDVGQFVGDLPAQF
jgi:Novel STAND NTPase 1/SIR2-like domain